jgi:hypothetical protein
MYSKNGFNLTATHQRVKDSSPSGRRKPRITGSEGFRNEG